MHYCIGRPALFVRPLCGSAAWWYLGPIPFMLEVKLLWSSDGRGVWIAFKWSVLWDIGGLMTFGQKSADLIGNLLWASPTSLVIPSEVDLSGRCNCNCSEDVD
jgi:hypothetical protein